MAFAPTLPLLFAGRVVSGLTGASMTVASSYMADISDDKNRSANFGMIGAGWGLGFIMGPMLGGLLGSWGPRAPFIAAACLNAVNFLYGLLVLPESLPASRRRKVVLRELNPIRTVLKVLSPSPFVALVWIYFLVFLGGQIHPCNWTLYTQTKFHWTAWQVGLSLSFVGVMIALSQGGLTRVIVPRLGEERSLTFGLFIYALSFGLFALAARGWMMYAIVVIFSLGGVTLPALQGILGKHVPAERQGELQGSLVSLGSAAAMLAPFVYTRLFVHFTRPGASPYFPGAAYMGASAICAFTLAMRLWQARAPAAAPAAAPEPA
jgi:DHA1 family tetracycline resistance protein-like MFS transporter